MKEVMRIHFVGIGGIGMSAIAKVLLEEGHTISGSDLKLSPITHALSQLGATVAEGHDAAHLGQADLVVVTSAAAADNPEVLEALRRGIPVIKRAEMLGRLMAQRRGIAVAGTHGKTTTSALIAHILECTGQDPTILVGGELVDLGTNAKSGRGPYLVAEADEFDGSFWQLRPQIALVTNIEPDHLDFYGTVDNLVAAFRRFLANVPQDGHVVVCADDPTLQAFTQEPSPTGQWTTYGFAPQAQWQATTLRFNPAGGYDFLALHRGQSVDTFRCLLPGLHNALNTLGALTVAHLLELDVEGVKEAIASFHGTRRRFELVGRAGDITVLDDYAHHPTEIKTTLRAVRERFGQRRIICAFQPHTYSRTRYLFDGFTTCFADADLVVIADIYAARERDTGEISSRTLVNAMKHPQKHYGGNLDQTLALLPGLVQTGDVVVIMGAGDIDTIGPKLLEQLAQR